MIRLLAVLCLAGQLAACAGEPAILENAAPIQPELPAELVVTSEVVDESGEAALGSTAFPSRPVHALRTASRESAGDVQARVRLAKESPTDIDALARMDRIVARHERDARQAASGVCAGCLGAFQAPQYVARTAPVPASAQGVGDRLVGRTGAMVVPVNGALPAVRPQ